MASLRSKYEKLVVREHRVRRERDGYQLRAHLQRRRAEDAIAAGRRLAAIASAQEVELNYAVTRNGTIL